MRPGVHRYTLNDRLAKYDSRMGTATNAASETFPELLGMAGCGRFPPIMNATPARLSVSWDGQLIPIAGI